MWNKFRFDEDLDAKIRAVKQSGLCYFDHDKGIFVPNRGEMNYDTNWLFFGYTIMSRDCYLWHQIMFTYFDFVPEFCKMRCYKVVIRLRNVKELMQWYGVCNGGGHCNRGDVTALPGKAGIDTRHYTDASYDSFIYADGLEDAKEKYEVVREMADTLMEDGKSISVIIKRSCTEFERRHGGTNGDWWQSFTDSERRTEECLKDMFAGRWESAVQPDWLKNKTFLRWLQHANAIGDKSWVEYMDKGDFLTCQPVTYHDIGSLTINNEKEVKQNDTSED